jgi:hypothetical protein
VKWPWTKDDECEHLVKYQERSLDIAGVNIPNIFSVGSVSIKPQVLQATKEAIQILDLTHYNNCKTLKMAPNEESKSKFFEEMKNQQKKLNDIAAAIAAYSTNPNSKLLEETLSRILISDMPIPESNKAEINKLIDVSMKNVKSSKDVTGPEIKTKGDKNVDGSMEGIVAEGDVTGTRYEEKD